MAEDGNQGSVASGQNKAHDGKIALRPMIANVNAL